MDAVDRQRKRCTTQHVCFVVNVAESVEYVVTITVVDVAMDSGVNVVSFITAATACGSGSRNCTTVDVVNTCCQ